MAELFALVERLPPLRRFAARLANLFEERAQLEALRAVAEDPRFATRLAELSLDLPFGEDVDRTPFTAILGQSRHLAGLGLLDLYSWGMRARALAGFERAHFRPHTLLLNRNAIGAEGVEALAASETWRRLRALGLYNNELGADGVGALARSETFAQLVSLDLRSNRIGEQGARALGEASHLGRLETLRLVGNTLRPAAAAALLGPGLPALANLDLQNTRLSDEAVAAMAAVRSFRGRPRQLNLASNQLTEAALRALAGAPWARELQVLVVDDALQPSAERLLPGVRLASKPRSW